MEEERQLLLMILSLGSINAMADTVTEEPHFSLETDHTEYSGDDSIIDMVKLHNTTDDIVYDITVQGNIPDEYQTDNGIKAPIQWSAEIPETAAGKDSEVKITFTKNRSGNTLGGSNNGQASETWNVQLKQSGITLEQGSSYRVSFKANSTEARTIKLAMLSPDYRWYGGQDIELTPEEQEITVDFTMDKTTDQNTTMVVSMGVIEGKETPASIIKLTEFSLINVK